MGTLDYLLRPRSVAIIGAATAKPSRSALADVEKYGFAARF